MTERLPELSRRRLLSWSAAAGAASLLRCPAFAADIPQHASARVIVDNDFAGDPDGLAALAHQLLSPKTRTVLITASFLSDMMPLDLPKGQTAKASATIARELIRQAGIVAPPPVIAGAEGPGIATPTEAARAIVAEAMRDDKLPLFVTCGGPLTNVATALRIDPRIAEKMTLIWIGGGNYPGGGWEYNCAADPEAARFVLETSRVSLWQVPQGAYRQCQYSIAEMGEEMRPISPFGDWLYQRFTTPPKWVDIAGAWPLGDSPLVLLSAISAESSEFVERPAPRLGPKLEYLPNPAGRPIRVYERLDTWLLFGDFLAQLRAHAHRSAEASARG